MSRSDWQDHDLEKLRDLQDAQDPRGLEQMIADDHYVEVEVEKATRYADGFEVSFDGGLCTFLRVPDSKKEIKADDMLRVYRAGSSLLGGLCHGFAVNGDVFEWKTPWERFAERIAMLARHDREKRESYAKNKASIDKWCAELTGPYAARVERFRADKPDFDVNGCSYEVYPVLMAQRIEAWVRRETETPEVDMDEREARGYIGEFRDRPHGEQAKVIHAGEPDEYGISGHQFDCACGMAMAVLMGREV
jgi:hypothetical protein